jgi:hypothetical protein
MSSAQARGGTVLVLRNPLPSVRDRLLDDVGSYPRDTAELRTEKAGPVGPWLNEACYNPPCITGRGSSPPAWELTTSRHGPLELTTSSSLTNTHLLNIPFIN